MDAAGYHFDELESSDDQLRFLGEYGTHPEHFKEKRPSVLKKLEKKKNDLQTAKEKADPVRKREKSTQVL